MVSTKNLKRIQTFGKKKTSTAVATVIEAPSNDGSIRVNGRPLHLIEPDVLRLKLYEPIALIGQNRLRQLNIRVRVSGGGHVSRVYAIRQAIAKGVVAFYQKFVDEDTKREVKDILMNYDRSLLVADPRRCETKKFGGPGARAKYQKSYR
ncbi:hypothetical protein GJ496_008691 [Pomphorhynchus laevis]